MTTGENMKQKSKIIRIERIKQVFLLILSLLALTSCFSPKIASLESVKEIRTEIKKTETKIIKVEKDYRKLVKEKPECQKDEISLGLEDIKTDIYTLRGKIEATELIVEADIKRYQTEARHAKLINYVILFGGLGIIVLLIKIRR